MGRSVYKPFMDRADEALEEGKTKLHPNAQEILHMDGARKLLARRLAEIFHSPDDLGSIESTLNPYNEKEGWGIQSLGFTFSSLGESGSQHARYERANKIRTIAVIAPGMLEGDVCIDEIEVSMADGEGEIIRNCGKTPLGIRTVKKETGSSEGPQVLKPNHTVRVFGPEAALRIIMETNRRPRRQVQQLLSGTFGCQFVYEARYFESIARSKSAAPPEGE